MQTLIINGQSQQVDVAPDMPLLWVLRDVLGLTGTKYGCGIAQCGVCTVHLDGQPIRSCVTPISAVAIDAAMAGNLCRCATYTRIRTAIHSVGRVEEA